MSRLGKTLTLLPIVTAAGAGAASNKNNKTAVRSLAPPVTHRSVGAGVRWRPGPKAAAPASAPRREPIAHFHFITEALLLVVALSSTPSPDGSEARAGASRRG